LTGAPIFSFLTGVAIGEGGPQRQENMKTSLQNSGEKMSISAIIIDSREPDWVKQLNFGDIPTSVQLLEQGDLMAASNDGELILVERKTPDDFLNSLKSDRLMLQLANMLTVTRWAYLMITGEFKLGVNGEVVTSRVTGWNWDAVQGAILSIQEMGVYVVHCQGDEDYEAAIIRLGNRDRSKVAPVPPAKQPHVYTQAEAVLAALPGIGFKRLKPVLDAGGGSPAWAIALLTNLDEVEKFPGVPYGDRQRIRNVLGLKTNEMLAINVRDGF
jgi:ERCC4-type nuclease